MLVGILLHSLIPYLVRPVPGLLWPVFEPASPWVDTLFWWIHGFRIPLFFFLAGLFASKTLATRSAEEFLRRRLYRLGVPLALGACTIVFPAMYLIWAMGWLTMGIAEPRHILQFRFGNGYQKDLVGLAHLWFLSYLLLYCVGLWMAIQASPRLHGLIATPRSAQRNIVATLACALLAFAAIWLDPRALTQFHNWLFPRTGEFCFYAGFFLLGLFPGAALLHATRRYWAPLLLLASLTFIPFTLLITINADPSITSLAGSPLAHLHSAPFAAVATLYALASTLGWCGCAAALIPAATRSLPRLLVPVSAAAMFLYIIHPPLVGIIQTALYGVPAPAAVKIFLALATACVIGLLLHPIILNATANVKARLLARFGQSLVAVPPISSQKVSPTQALPAPEPPHT